MMNLIKPTGTTYACFGNISRVLLGLAIPAIDNKLARVLDLSAGCNQKTHIFEFNTEVVI